MSTAPHPQPKDITKPHEAPTNGSPRPAHTMAYLAQGYWQLGWPVIALHYPIPDGTGDVRCSCGHYPCGKDNRNAGKHPVAAAWQKQEPGIATILEATALWRTMPAANIGVPTGRTSGLFCLDFDGEEGLASLAALEDRLGQLPVTPTQRTGGGGLQVFFRAPMEPLKNTVSTLASKVDTRAEGGQCVVAPSLHRSGRRYEWVHKPSATPVAELPHLWLEAIRSASTPARQEGVVSTAMGPTRAFTPRPRGVAVAALANLAQSEVWSWMKSHPDQVSRLAWIAAATNIAAAVKGYPDLEALGRELFHEMSRPYRGYTKWECDREWRSALDFGRPSGWAAMEGLPERLVIPGTTNWLHAVSKGGR